MICKPPARQASLVKHRILAQREGRLHELAQSLHFGRGVDSLWWTVALLLLGWLTLASDRRASLRHSLLTMCRVDLHFPLILMDKWAG